MTVKTFDLRSKIASIKPDAEEASTAPDAKIDEIGDRHGLVAREPIHIMSRRKPAEPQQI
ncbi:MULTISPECIES: hypothetical protein [unclassified Rhizobium]|uniref:hypothetical protein n=1 Tax=unclassified Rhizobium TaxID=2613769 RepID=UPI001FD969D5|nr:MULTISPECIES: hypothetical protein [unclassified Rhizobium]MBP2463918.1 hypothetical protein [Rhizobium sp. PvP014]MBP2532284.1 hypothetical protein [Rhizobium sp. PvP099]